MCNIIRPARIQLPPLLARSGQDADAMASRSTSSPSQFTFPRSALLDDVRSLTSRCSTQCRHLLAEPLEHLMVLEHMEPSRVQQVDVVEAPQLYPRAGRAVMKKNIARSSARPTARKPVFGASSATCAARPEQRASALTANRAARRAPASCGRPGGSRRAARRWRSPASPPMTNTVTVWSTCHDVHLNEVQVPGHDEHEEQPTAIDERPAACWSPRRPPPVELGGQPARAAHRPGRAARMCRAPVLERGRAWRRTGGRRSAGPPRHRPRRLLDAFANITMAELNLQAATTARTM